MNVFDNITYTLKLKKVPKDEIKVPVIKALTIVQLEHTINRRPQDLSEGQQQRIAIAHTVINRPKMLLLDKPLSSDCNGNWVSTLSLSPRSRRNTVYV